MNWFQTNSQCDADFIYLYLFAGLVLPPRNRAGSWHNGFFGIADQATSLKSVEWVHDDPKWLLFVQSVVWALEYMKQHHLRLCQKQGCEQRPTGHQHPTRIPEHLGKGRLRASVRWEKFLLRLPASWALRTNTLKLPVIIHSSDILRYGQIVYTCLYK